jgi:XTP/dITP diphosphohydrolase
MTKTPTKELLIATRNAGKIVEVESLLDGLPLRLRSLAEFPEIGEVEETGTTFAENAALKASNYAAQTRLWTLADDSGLEVEALGGAPGVYSARYAGGAGATDAERNAKLLAELSRTRDAERRARFVCVIAISDPSARLVNSSTGICEGRIALAPRGVEGFGYDPVFIPEGYQQSFGELLPEIKQRISHRARALEAARSFLLNYSLG